MIWPTLVVVGTKPSTSMILGRTLHRHDSRQLPLRQSSPSEDRPERFHTWLHPEKGLANKSIIAPPSMEATPPQAKMASTASGNLQLDIALEFMKGSVSPPPRLPSLSLRNRRGIQALSVRRKEERQWLENR